MPLAVGLFGVTVRMTATLRNEERLRLAESGTRDRQHLPLARDALELVDAAIVERQARSDDEVAHRAGDDDLARVGQRGDAGADVDGEAGEVVAPLLALAGVDAGAHAQPEALRG